MQAAQLNNCQCWGHDQRYSQLTHEKTVDTNNNIRKMVLQANGTRVQLISAYGSNKYYVARQLVDEVPYPW